MSRVGRLPIDVPKGVEVTVEGSHVKVKGPKGELAWTFSTDITIRQENGQVLCERHSDAPSQRALHGTARALINNMIIGVNTGFQRVLEVNGVGYRAELSGQNLILNVGYSHPVTVVPPVGISFDVDAKTRQVFVRGTDKAQVGQVAADLRKVRPPEPYKGKGIKYLEEKIRQKAGKAGKTGK